MPATETKEARKEAQDQMEKYTAKAKAQAEEAASYGRDNYEAWMKSTTIVMEGAQDMMKYWTNSLNKAREQNAAAIKTFMSCKTLNDMTETGARIAQQNMEETLSSATEMSERSVRLCMDAFEPLNEQFSTTFQKMNPSKAA